MRLFALNLGLSWVLVVPVYITTKIVAAISKSRAKTNAKKQRVIDHRPHLPVLRDQS